MKRTTLVAVLLAGTALATPASADNLNFFSGTNYSGAFSGANTVYNSIITTNTPQSCANGASCATDHIGAPNTTQTYGTGTDGLTASANTGQGVWDDAQPNYGGLGVGVNVTGVNDNIDGTNVLTLTFNVPVQLTGIATLFDSNLHGPFGNLNDLDANGTNRTVVCPTCETFLLNGVSTRFDVANFGLLNLPTGTTFTFAEDPGIHAGNIHNTSFYVSGVSFLPGQSVSVPGPIVGAGIPGIVAAAGALWGLGWRRRRRAFVS